MEKFIPKRYRNYVTINVRLTSKHKKYLENIPSFLKERPRALFAELRMKWDPQLKKVLTLFSR